MYLQQLAVLSSNQIWLVVGYGLGFVFLLGAICGALCALCLKANGRNTAINVTLALATVSVVSLSAMAVLSPRLTDGKDKPKETMVERKVEMGVSRISSEQYLLKHDEFCRKFPDFIKPLGSSSFDDYLNYLPDLRKDKPKDEMLALKYILLRHASEKLDVDDCQKFALEFPKSRFKAILFLLVGKHDDIDRDTASVAEAIVKRKFQPGWFRDEALLALGQNTHHPELVKPIEDKRAAKVIDARWMIYLYLIYFYAQFVISAVALIYLCAEYIRLKKFGAAGLTMVDCSYRSIYGCALLAFFAQILAAIWFGLGYGMSHGKHADSTQIDFSAGMDMAVMSTTLLSVLLSVYFFVSRPANYKGLIPNLDLPKGGILVALCSGVTACCMANSFGFFLTELLDHFMSSESTNPVNAHLVSLAHSPNMLDATTMVIAIGVIGPLAEEILFRGLLHTRLRKHLPMLASSLITAAIFGACHLDFNVFLRLTLMGLAFSLVYERTGSLWSSWVAHALNNTTSVLIYVMLGAL